MKPSYLEKLTPVELDNKVRRLYELLQDCRVCPNNCSVNRIAGETGDCHSTDEVIISSASPHFGEEPPLVGFRGSGTIFFTSCNLSCQFCQNYDISQLRRGEIVSTKELAAIMIKLQNIGCHNINLVTPTHFTPQIVKSISIAVEMGLELPIVYNCGGYESVETLELIEDIIDIYMPDIKYSDNKNAQKYSGITNYWDIVKKAVIEMNRQVGNLHIDSKGIAKRGLLIRHLVLPNDIAGSETVIDFIVNEISPDSYVNIMDQYRPAYNSHKYTELNRSLNEIEYKSIVDYAKKFGVRLAG